MAFYNPNKHISDHIGIRSPHRAFRPKRVVNTMLQKRRAPQSAIENGLKFSLLSQASSWRARYGGTAAALIIGSLKGGWPFAAILAAIALGESLAVIAHVKTCNRPANCGPPN
jgi:hypothetical protein